MEIEDDVDGDGDGEKAESNEGYEVDLVADALEVFHEFLLLECVSVGGFANHFELVFDALEGGVLFDDLIAELALLGLELGEAVFEGGEIDGRRRRRRGRRGVVVRSEEVGDGGADVAVEQGENALDEGQGDAEGADGALNPGGTLGGGVGEGAGGRRRVGGAGRGRQGTGEGAGLDAGLRGGQDGRAPAADGEGRADCAGAGLLGSGGAAAFFVGPV